MKALMLPMYLLGKMLGAGIKNALFWWNIDQTEDLLKAQNENTTPSTFKAPDTAEKLLRGDISRIDSEKARYSKYSPDTVTYGDRGGKEGVGFMTVGQAEFKLKREREAKEKKLEDYRNEMKGIAVDNRNASIAIAMAVTHKQIPISTGVESANPQVPSLGAVDFKVTGKSCFA
jgi:hypothetical protein